MTNIQQYTIVQVLPNKLNLYDSLYDRYMPQQVDGGLRQCKWRHFPGGVKDEKCLKNTKQLECVSLMAELTANEGNLTPGRYVGVANQIDDDFDYESRMAEIKMELQSLNDESVKLAAIIQKHLKELGL